MPQCSSAPLPDFPTLRISTALRAARIDDVTRETKLYFQTKKSQMVDLYKLDEAFIETQSGNCIKVVRSD